MIKQVLKLCHICRFYDVKKIVFPWLFVNSSKKHFKFTLVW